MNYSRFAAPTVCKKRQMIKIRELLYNLVDPILLKVISRSEYLKANRLKPVTMADVHANAHLYEECIIENQQSNSQAIQIGSWSHIAGKLMVFPHGGKISIGEYCYVGHRSEIWSSSEIIIGDRVLIAHNVNIIDSSSHSFHPLDRHEHFVRIIRTGHPSEAEYLPGIVSAPIFIEDDVWISFGVSVLRGVRIGARSIIAANSIVTKDVPPDVFYKNKFEPIIIPLKYKNDSGIDEDVRDNKN